MYIRHVSKLLFNIFKSHNKIKFNSDAKIINISTCGHAAYPRDRPPYLSLLINGLAGDGSVVHAKRVHGFRVNRAGIEH